jgi:fatty-acid desaturase
MDMKGDLTGDPKEEKLKDLQTIVSMKGMLITGKEWWLTETKMKEAEVMFTIMAEKISGIEITAIDHRAMAETKIFPQVPITFLAIEMEAMATITGQGKMITGNHKTIPR